MSLPPLPRRSLLTAAAVSVTLLAGGCSSSPQDDSPEQASAARPADLDRFHQQKLAFGSCKDYATTPADEKLFATPGLQCARLDVPLDYGSPDGEKAQIAVLRVPARGTSKGPLVLNSGGPGGTGQNFAAQTGIALAKSPVTENFDLIGFDPRGVGATKPSVHCFTPEDRRTGKARTEFVLTAGNFSAKDSQALADKCSRGSGGDKTLKAVSTRDTVQDMEILRSALGAEKLNFLGQSYGTRIGALYAQKYPKRVRAMVFDGAVDPHLGAERRLSQYAGFQASFDKMAAACTKSKDCPLGSDPERATKVFNDLARPLLAKPITYGQGLTFDYNALIDSVLAGLYYQEVWPGITKGLADVKKGDPGRLVKISQAFSGQDGQGGGSNFSEANYAITCMDEERMTTEEAVTMREKTYRAAPFVDPGTGSGGARDACEFWPVQPKTTYPFPEKVDGLPTTLTISITGDPSTPYQAGINLAKTLGGSLLTVKGEQHTIASAGTSACVNKAVAAYLIDLRAPSEESSCTL
ncbi:alpha/beta hydrolase [Streptomyces pakalii]|uniref:Alpha/beta hydrolase n=1 Tax=Streptomyces pakalii TaxID=3036494 RepID=A0ABT7DHJ7_9ACTN|nr:alpha/beta hydrolase [Streptomyces pakalii]MDJ1645277.1 alpha/beta hydrolase [Streptomyces pakalii]